MNNIPFRGIDAYRWCHIESMYGVGAQRHAEKMG
jgi:hypothetical protein